MMEIYTDGFFDRFLAEQAVDRKKETTARRRLKRETLAAIDRAFVEGKVRGKHLANFQTNESWRGAIRRLSLQLETDEDYKPRLLLRGFGGLPHTPSNIDGREFSMEFPLIDFIISQKKELVAQGSREHVALALEAAAKALRDRDP